MSEVPSAPSNGTMLSCRSLPRTAASRSRRWLKTGWNPRRLLTTTSRFRHLASSTRTGPCSDRTRTVRSICEQSIIGSWRDLQGEPYGAARQRGDHRDAVFAQARQHGGMRMPVTVLAHRNDRQRRPGRDE